MNKADISYKSIRLRQIRRGEQHVPSVPDEATDQALLTSISRFGILDPLVVTDNQKHRYTIIDGYRRFEVARTLRLKTVPCVIHPSLTKAEIEVLRFQLHQTFKRLTKAEQAKALRRLEQLNPFPLEDERPNAGI